MRSKPRVTRRKLARKVEKKNFSLTNFELLKEMAGPNHSWFVDELIAREYRRREKRANDTLSKNSV